MGGAWLGAVTLVAFALRVAGLDAWGSLDFDEQASFFIGSMAPGDMLRYLLGAPFEHPPLFYLLFHAWLAAAGGSETAMRLFAVVPGTLAVPLLGFAVARVSDTRTGIIAAAALALAPLHVFHSRDARMYTLLALLMTAMLAAIASGMARRAAIAAVLAIAALATHYYAVFGVIGLAAGWLVGRSSRISPLPRFRDPVGRGLVPRRAPSLISPSGRGQAPPLSDEKPIPAGSDPRAARQRATPETAQAEPVEARALRRALRVPARRVRSPQSTQGGRSFPDALGASIVAPMLRRLWPLFALGAVTVVAGLLWVSSASGLRISLTAVKPRAVDPADLLWALVQSLGAPLAGPLAAPALTAVAAATTAGLLGLGWWTSRRGHDPDARRALLDAAAWGGFAFTTIGIPLLLFLGRPFAPRFVVFGTPFLAALLALGSRRLGTRALAAAAAVYVVVAGIGLASMYGGYERSDYGEALARLRSEVRPDDGVILNGPWQDLLYRRYGVGLPPGRIVASTVPLQVDETVGWLRQITAEHPRVWVVDSATDLTDPTGAVAAWLDANAYPRPVIEYQKAVLRPYLTEQGGRPLVGRPVDASSLGIQLTSVAMDSWTLAPGAESRLWIEGAAAAGAGGLSARAVVDLLSSDGSSVWHWDGPLARAGERLTFRAAVLVPTGTPTGSYTLQLTPYEATPSAPRRVTRIGQPVAFSNIVVE